MRIGYGISVADSNQRSFASVQAEQVVWKVAVYGAGTPTSNGEYVWDGTTLINAKPVYLSGANNISWNEFGASGIFEWGIYDDDLSNISFVSYDLISWSNDRGDGTSPAPSSALSYAQDSFISSLTLAGADSGDINGQYSRASGGLASFSGPATEFGNASIDWDSGNSAWAVTNGDEQKYGSIDLFSWYPLAGGEPAPTATAIVYSA